MRICLYHATKIEEALQDEELIALVPEVMGEELINHVDGDSYNYDWYRLADDVAKRADGCPVCFIEKIVGEKDYCDNLIDRLKHGEFKWKVP